MQPFLVARNSTGGRRCVLIQSRPVAITKMMMHDEGNTGDDSVC